MPADCNSNRAIDRRVLRTSRTSIYHFYTFLYISPICLQDQEEVVRQVRHGFLNRVCGTNIDKQKKVKPCHGIVFVDVCHCLPTFRYNSIHVCHALSHPVDACEQNQRCQSLSSCQLHPMSPSRFWKKVCVRTKQRIFRFLQELFGTSFVHYFRGHRRANGPGGKRAGL